MQETDGHTPAGPASLDAEDCDDAEAADVPQTGGLTVVGIGASAGGLAALKKLFAAVPENSGFAYVVVMHLAPHSESHLADLLQPHAQIPVLQATDAQPLLPDHAYVIPPGRNLAAVGRRLNLAALAELGHDRAPIDHFLTTLAETHEHRAAGVILTGLVSDCAIGVKRIKRHGGFTIAQDPNEAEYDGMSQSAIATGMVDRVLPLGRIPEELIRSARTAPRIGVPRGEQPLDEAQEDLLQKILARIHAQTGRDFRRYKRSTLMRRISRRMQIRHIEHAADYLQILQRDGLEARALSDEFLINVTEFFRDEQVFRALEQNVIPGILAAKDAQRQTRVWSVGCSTGEEAYSLAILLLEEAARRGSAPNAQVFASDLHEPSLQRARDGHFPETIERSVSPQRLQRFFQRENGGYRVRREVRDLVLFATHNVLSDAPFSKIDLIVCRNLLIYLPRDAQNDVVQLFHYALNPNGVLVLGPSESIERTDLFQVTDKNHCLHRRQNVAAVDPHVSVFPLHAPRPQRAAHVPSHGTRDLAYDSVHAWLLQRTAPPSVLIDAKDEVVHLSPGAGEFLLPPAGKLTGHVFKLVREEFRLELRFAVQAARRTRRAARSKPIAFCSGSVSRHIVLAAHPAEGPEHEGLLLLTFTE